MANVIVCYALSVVVILVLPLFDVHLSLGHNLLVGGVFTVVSIARSYLVRRLFETRLGKR